MKSKKILLILVLLITIIVLVSVDQVTKILIEKNNIELTIIPNVLNITYVQNNGIAFGTQLINRYFIIITNIILIIVLGVVMYMDRKRKVELMLLAIVISGAISNVIDRIFRGYIIDFIQVQIKIFNSPVFNFADTYITVGIILYLFFYIRSGIKENRETEKEEVQKEKKEEIEETNENDDYEENEDNEVYCEKNNDNEEK